MARQTRYTERLGVAWWLWLPAVGVAGLLAAEVYLGAPGMATWVPYVVLLPLATGGLWWLGRVRVTVADGELFVDDAHLPVRFIADARPISGDEKRDLLGPHAEADAFVVQRPWIPAAVLVELDDPADPTPYWVISTRQPDRLVSALLAERGEATRPMAR